MFCWGDETCCAYICALKGSSYSKPRTQLVVLRTEACCVYRYTRSLGALHRCCSFLQAAVTASFSPQAYITCTTHALQVPCFAPHGQGRAAWSSPCQWLLTALGQCISGAAPCCWCPFCAEAAQRLQITSGSWRSVLMSIFLFTFSVHLLVWDQTGRLLLMCSNQQED